MGGDQRRRRTHADGERIANGERSPAAPGDAALLLLYADAFAELEPVFVLEGDVAIIGRTPPAQVVIAHPTISRMHARIARSDEAYVLRDLGGRNGVLVGGRRVTEAVLTHGDEICIGDVLLQFVAYGGRAYAAYRIDGALDAEDLPEIVTSCMKDYGKPPTEAPSRGSVVPGAPDAANVGRVLGKDRAQIHRWMQMFGIDPAAHR